jgi:hypothetical protein
MVMSPVDPLCYRLAVGVLCGGFLIFAKARTADNQILLVSSSTAPFTRRQGPGYVLSTLRRTTLYSITTKRYDALVTLS